MGIKYKYIRIGKEDAKYFNSLDPFDRLSFLSMPYGFAIGAFLEDEDSMTPAGIMVGCASEEFLSVEWLAVDPDYRFQGIGEELLIKAFQLADVGNIPVLYVPMLPDFKKEIATQNAKSYFEERLFTDKETIGADEFCQLVELTDSGIMKNDSDVRNSISGFSGIPRAKIKETIDKLCMIDTATYTYSPDLFSGKLDTDLCFVSASGSDIEGALLTAKFDNIVSPVYYYAKSEKIGDALIREAIRAAENKYGMACNVMITMRQPETVNIVERVLGPQERCEYLKASVQEYKNGSEE